MRRVRPDCSNQIVLQILKELLEIRPKLWSSLFVCNLSLYTV
jgi:hypothetical protein